jgi:histidine ammonia-lyase
MGANAATKLYRVVQNCFTIQAIEILNGTQALEFRRPLKSSKRVEEIVAKYREIVPFVEKDKYLQPEIAKSRNFVVAGF